MSAQEQTIQEYPMARKGTGRRMSDQHCANHEKNTTDLAALKSSMRTIQWIVGLLVPIAVVLLGYFQSQNNEVLKKIDTNVSTVQSIVAAGVTTDAILKLEIENLKRDIDTPRK